jgi:hypothetical protein
VLFLANQGWSTEYWREGDWLWLGCGIRAVIGRAGKPPRRSEGHGGGRWDSFVGFGSSWWIEPRCDPARGMPPLEERVTTTFSPLP